MGHLAINLSSGSLRLSLVNIGLLLLFTFIGTACGALFPNRKIWVVFKAIFGRPRKESTVIRTSNHISHIIGSGEIVTPKASIHGRGAVEPPSNKEGLDE
jgi:hypothetical protein